MKTSKEWIQELKLIAHPEGVIIEKHYVKIRLIEHLIVVYISS